MELETLKTYIKINLANSFIRTSKSSADAPIFFAKTPHNNFWFCVNYRGLNNLTSKNRYPLPLIGKFLNWLGQVK